MIHRMTYTNKYLVKAANLGSSLFGKAEGIAAKGLDNVAPSQFKRTESFGAYTHRTSPAVRQNARMQAGVHTAPGSAPGSFDTPPPSEGPMPKKPIQKNMGLDGNEFSDAKQKVNDAAKADKDAARGAANGWADIRPGERKRGADHYLNNLKRNGGAFSSTLASGALGVRSYVGNLTGASASAATRHADTFKRLAAMPENANNRFIRRAAGLGELNAQKLTKARNKTRLYTAGGAGAAYLAHKKLSQPTEEGYDPYQYQTPTTL